MRLSMAGLFGASLAALLLSAGCGSNATLDLCELQQPIVMNGNPFCGRPAAPKALKVALYKAAAGSGNVTFGGNTAITSQDNAQDAAFKYLGGRKSRAITNVTVVADAFALYFLLVAEGAHVSVNGPVMDYALGGN